MQKGTIELANNPSNVEDLRSLPTDAGDFELFTTIRFDPTLIKPPFPDTVQSSTWLWPLHQARLLDAARELGWDEVEEKAGLKEAESVALIAIREAIGVFYSLNALSDQPWTMRHWARVKEKGALRIKLLVSRHGRLRTEILNTPALPMSKFPNKYMLFGPFASRNPITGLPPIYVDTEPSPISQLSRHKSTSRKIYDAARARAGLTGYDKPGEVLLVNQVGNIMDGSIVTVYVYRENMWTTPTEACGCHIGATRRLTLAQKWCVEDKIPVSSFKLGEMVWVSNALKGYFLMIFEGYRGDGERSMQEFSFKYKGRKRTLAEANAGLPARNPWKRDGVLATTPSTEQSRPQTGASAGAQSCFITDPGVADQSNHPAGSAFGRISEGRNSWHDNRAVPDESGANGQAEEDERRRRIDASGGPNRIINQAGTHPAYRNESTDFGGYMHDNDMEEQEHDRLRRLDQARSGSEDGAGSSVSSNWPLLAWADEYAKMGNKTDAEVEAEAIRILRTRRRNRGSEIT